MGNICFSSPWRPDRLSGSPILHGSKAAVASSRPLTSILCRGHFHSPACLHGVVGTTSPLILLSCDGVTTDGVCIGNRICWTLKQLVTTLYISLSHTEWCSQSSLRCLVAASTEDDHFLWVPELSQAPATSFSTE
jgi:hypothetical protein